MSPLFSIKLILTMCDESSGKVTLTRIKKFMAVPQAGQCFVIAPGDGDQRAQIIDVLLIPAEEEDDDDDNNPSPIAAWAYCELKPAECEVTSYFLTEMYDWEIV